MDKKKRPKGFRDNYLAPVLAILMLLFWGTANAQVTPVAKVATITQLKAYNGTAAFVWVMDSLKIYTPCSPCTPDEVYVFAGAGGKNWQTDSTFRGGSSTIDTTSLSDRIEDRLLKSALKDSLTGYAKESDLTDKADLVGGKVPTSQIPAIAITEFLGSVDSEEEMLELSGDPGDWCSRTDNERNYMLVTTGGGDLSDWRIIGMPSSPVESVNSQTGVIVLGKGDVGLGNVANVDQTNASNISSGTVADARLSANIPMLDGANAWLALNRFNEGAVIPAAKKLTIYGTADETTNYRRLVIDNSGAGSQFSFDAQSAGTEGPGAYYFKIGGSNKMMVQSTNVVMYSPLLPGSNNTYDLGLSNYRFKTGYFGTSIGIGVTTAPAAGLHIRSTTEQLRSEYDANNRWSATTGSTGRTTFNAVGEDSLFHFADSVTFAKGIAQAQVNNLADTLAQLHTDVAGKADTAHAIRIKTLSTNRSTSSTSSSAVTGMEFPVVAGKDYWFKFFVSYNSDATTTGSRWMIAAPTGGGTAVRYKSYWTLDADNDSRYNGFTGFNLPGTANASSLATGNIAVIEGLLRCGESGDMTLRFASEVGSSSITALAGYSFVQWQVVN